MKKMCGHWASVLIYTVAKLHNQLKAEGCKKDKAKQNKTYLNYESTIILWLIKIRIDIKLRSIKAKNKNKNKNSNRSNKNIWEQKLISGGGQVATYSIITYTIFTAKN